MVEADAGNDRQERVYDVGTVKASAQADFDNGYINLVFGKIAKGHSGGQFKKGGAEIRSQDCSALFASK